MGRIGADIYPQSDGPLEGVAAFSRALAGFGVDTRFVSSTPDLPTPVVFAELDPPEEPRIWFYRYPKAPDMMLTVEDLDRETVRDAAIFWATGTGLSDEP